MSADSVAQARAPHLHPGLIALVALGGAVGTLARWALTTTVPAREGWPVATLVENLVGAFLLGLLLEALVRAGEETPRRRILRLGLGTGLLGGFTTFSTFALEVERLLAGGDGAQALAYFGLSICGGFLMCLAGVVVASGHHRRRSRRLPVDPDEGAVGGPAEAGGTDR